MSDWTKRDAARVAFLDAAVNFFRAYDDKALAADCMPRHAKLELAWHTYRDLLDGKEENVVLDEHRWFCPHCGKERPKFAWQLIGEALMGIGAIQYFNVFCAEENCRKLLSVATIGFVPEQQMVELARAQMKQKFGGQV